MPTVIVYPPDEQGGRRVRVDELDVARAEWIEWRGGGPDVWEH
ncbi:hypothetical protein ACFV20_19355 [Streptomyces sp. NPDC059696]